MDRTVMNSVVFLVLRRMRPPLLALIISYTIAILGLVLIPGVDDQGQPWHMDFLHAFYVVSYTATTTGYGEIPYAFNGMQRLWVSFTIYLTAITWVYAIGSLIRLLQDPALQQAITETTFARAVRRIRHPFYLVCGYGETGAALVRSLVDEGKSVVVVDTKPERINALSLEDHPVDIPALCADASEPDVLRLAGLRNPHCQALIAISNRDDINLHIAITGKLLHKDIRIIARSGAQETAANMASFGTEYIIDPFETFADRLFVALHAPCLDAMRQWLFANGNLTSPSAPPHGRWLLCGFGRFGQSLLKRFQAEGIETVLLEATPEETGLPTDPDVRIVRGWGTGAPELLEAGVKDAVGIVAGTNNDTNNLSILMTARDLNPDLYMVARQNRHANTPLFRAIRANLVAEGSQIISERIRTLLNQPMLVDFLREVRRQGDRAARRHLVTLAAHLGEQPPRLRQCRVHTDDARALEYMAERGVLNCQDVVNGMENREGLRPIALLLQRGSERVLLPAPETNLQVGDEILFATPPDHFRELERRLCDEHCWAERDPQGHSA
ncbi:MAG: potassium channel family protein [Gammaproteobacteria bacterium]